MRVGGKPVVLLFNVLIVFIVFLLAKEEARYRQPTDVQKPTALYAAVLTGRCTGAETVVCRCSNIYITDSEVKAGYLVGRGVKRAVKQGFFGFSYIFKGRI
jgi:hypothetical protein